MELCLYIYYFGGLRLEFARHAMCKNENQSWIVPNTELLLSSLLVRLTELCVICNIINIYR